MDVLYRELALSEGDRKVEILLEMGDAAVSKLSDSDYAAKSYLLALSERPNDRTILTKLMQLYGAEKDWLRGWYRSSPSSPRSWRSQSTRRSTYTPASMIASRELFDFQLASNLLGEALRARSRSHGGDRRSAGHAPKAARLRGRQERAQAAHRAAHRRWRQRQTVASLNASD